nr:hypothetical protein Iba_chr13bCG16480 [Ipomoea batatas]
MIGSVWGSFLSSSPHSPEPRTVHRGKGLAIKPGRKLGGALVPGIDHSVHGGFYLRVPSTAHSVPPELPYFTKLSISFSAQRHNVSTDDSTIREIEGYTNDRVGSSRATGNQVNKRPSTPPEINQEAGPSG